MSKVLKNRNRNHASNPKSLLSRRVVRDQDKAGKKELILDLAASLLERIEFGDLSMDLIAKEAGLAKGTLYLYFKTKEEIGLEVLKRDYQFWFRALRKSLGDGVVNSSEALAKSVSNSLMKMPRFLKLLPLGSSILESNVSAECILEYKIELASQLEITATALGTCFPGLSFEKASMLLIQIHIVAVGAWSHGFPNQNVKKVIEENSLQGLQFDYFDLLEETIGLISAASLSDFQTR